MEGRRGMEGERDIMKKWFSYYEELVQAARNLWLLLCGSQAMKLIVLLLPTTNSPKLTSLSRKCHFLES